MQPRDHRPILLDLPNEIIGERVLLRPYLPGDSEHLWEAIQECRAYLKAWLPWPDWHKSPGDSEEFVRRSHAKWVTREDLIISIWHRESGRFLGGSGIHRINWSVPSCEIGYWLRKSAEGFGYMTETVRLLTRLAIDRMHMERIFIRCAVGNVRSSAVPKRLGYQHEGVMRNEIRLTDGRVVDADLFSFTPSDRLR